MKRKKKELGLKFIWNIRLKLRAEGDKLRAEGSKEELLKIFKNYSYEEIMQDGKQCFVIDVDRFLETISSDNPFCRTPNQKPEMTEDALADFIYEQRTNKYSVSLAKAICAKFLPLKGDEG